MSKMIYLSSQISNAELLPTTRSAQFFGKSLKHRYVIPAVLLQKSEAAEMHWWLDISLLIELILVTFAAILAIKALDSGFLFFDTWFAAPGILIAAAIIPTIIKRRKFVAIDFNIKQISDSLVVLGWTCMVVFPATFVGCWLLKSYGLDLPLRPLLPKGQNWICWLFYQFMYVAVAEEVFFRGYVQDNILRLMSIAKLEQQLSKFPTLGYRAWMSIMLSAVCFAAAHIIVQGQIISVLTFLPGLILGWLFIRTNSLLAPILFHGLANICYFLIAAALA
jgi:membrane protease YdiL (CAAX protease family)